MKNYTSVIQDQKGFILLNKTKIAQNLGITPEELMSYIGSSSSSMSKYKLAIVQIPYVHKDYHLAENVVIEEAEQIPLVLSCELENPKFNSSMGIDVLSELFCQPVVQDFQKNDNFVYASEYFKQGLRYKVKLLVLSSKIEPEDLTMLKLRIKIKGSGSETFRLMPIVQFYLLEDIDIVLNDRIATINISRNESRLFDEGRSVNIFTFRFKIKKDSPNSAEIKKLIELVRFSMKIDSVCLDVFEETFLA